MPERFFYVGQKVSVSNEFVTSGTDTYPLGDITSSRIALKTVRPENNFRWWASWASFIGTIILVLVYFFYQPPTSTLAKDTLNCFLFLLVVLQARISPLNYFQYTVKLKGTFGDADLNITAKESWANDIVKAIKAAKNWDGPAVATEAQT